MTAPVLHWLPPLTDPDAAFAAIKAAPSSEQRFSRIVEVARHQLDFVQTGKLDRLLQRTLVELPRPTGLAPVRLAWLGSSTLDHLVPSARIAGLRRGLLVESYLAPYGLYRQELLDPASGLAAFAPDVLLLALDPEHVRLELPLGASHEQVEALVADRVGDLRALWQHARDRLGCVVIQQTIPPLAPSLFGSLDRSLPGAPRAVLARLDRALVEAAASTRTPILDLEAAVMRDGAAIWFDEVRWLQAKQLVSPAAAPLYGDLVARLLAAIRGRARKCLVLDLDNTLWGGVVGDDGVERFVIGQGSAAGEAFTGIQQYARRLKERGIVLAVCSKNDRAIAESAFAQHPDMVLALDDFAAFFANWDDKATNLRRIAETLDLGLDSLVFVDDNPAERALVRAELSAVEVPELPDDPALFVRAISDGGYFEAVSFTDEDLARARRYQDNQQRAQELATATDMDGFLRGLAMTLWVGPIDSRTLVRVTQLVNKTNQFNVTTRRYTEPALQAFVADPRNLALQFRLVDRLGDNGLIAVLLAAGSGDTLEIDTLLMSCRVLGRGVEQAMINELVSRAVARGLGTITGSYHPTARNAMVADLFARLGFTSAGPADDAGVTHWRLSTADFQRLPTFIEVKEAT
jgi:FkbH-like protein